MGEAKHIEDDFFRDLVAWGGLLHEVQEPGI